jgi:hypothetical protein
MKKLLVTKIVYPLEAGKRTFIVNGVERTKYEHEQFIQGVLCMSPNIQLVENTVIHSPHS